MEELRQSILSSTGNKQLKSEDYENENVMEAVGDEGNFNYVNHPFNLIEENGPEN